MGSDSPFLVMVDGANMEETLDVSESPFHVTQSLVEALHFFWGVVLLGEGGLQQVLALGPFSFLDGFLVSLVDQLKFGLLFRVGRIFLFSNGSISTSYKSFTPASFRMSFTFSASLVQL